MCRMLLLYCREMQYLHPPKVGKKNMNLVNLNVYFKVLEIYSTPSGDVVWFIACFLIKNL